MDRALPRYRDLLEMPGLLLTKPQMGRLWGLDSLTCDAILAALVEEGFLMTTGRGGYVLASRRV